MGFVQLPAVLLLHLQQRVHQELNNAICNALIVKEVEVQLHACVGIDCLIQLSLSVVYLLRHLVTKAAGLSVYTLDILLNPQLGLLRVVAP